MMEQVLLIGRADEGKLECSPAPIELAQLVLKLTEESLCSAVRCCPVNLHLEEGLDQVVGDESLLRHIFSNLLSNAAKYSSSASAVDFHIFRDGKNVIFLVEDHGIGIPIVDQPRIFDAFQRAGNVGEIPGTGLGLLIVKRCVELHGGDIDFKSSPEEGTTFTVRLPLFT